MAKRGFLPHFAQYLPSIANIIAQGLRERTRREERQDLLTQQSMLEQQQEGLAQRVLQGALEPTGLPLLENPNFFNLARPQQSHLLNIVGDIEKGRAESRLAERVQLELEKGRRGESINYTGLPAESRINIQQTLLSELQEKDNKVLEQIKTLNPATDSKDIVLLMNTMSNEGRSTVKSLFPTIGKTIETADPEMGMVSIVDQFTGETIREFFDPSRIKGSRTETIEENGIKKQKTIYNAGYVTEKIIEKSDGGDPYKSERKNLDKILARMQKLQSQILPLQKLTEEAKRFHAQTDLGLFTLEGDPSQVTIDDLLKDEILSTSTFTRLAQGEDFAQTSLEEALADMVAVIGDAPAQALYDKAETQDIERLKKDAINGVASGESPFNGHQLELIVKFFDIAKFYFNIRSGGQTFAR